MEFARQAVCCDEPRRGSQVSKAALLFLLISWFGIIARAGIIEGITLENFTGLPLARTRLTLQRLEGDKLKQVGTATASRDGRFSFGALAEGYYQLTAARRGFADGKFGQHLGGGPGLPIYVKREGVQFPELRLKRLGVITGRTLDENGVGLPGVSLHAYTAGAPMRIAGSAVSDDLGVYRITGLPAGKYFIRTGPAQVDEALKLLPTYYPFSTSQLRDARSMLVELDSETTDVNIQPVEGRLSSLAVGVKGCIGVAQVTLSSDTGRRQAIAPCNLDDVSFGALSAGEYEILAEGEADHQKLAAFASVRVDSDGRVELPLRPLVDLRVRLNETAGPAGSDGVIVRRRDLAGEGTETKITSDRVPLLPGFWQITARPTSGSYLSGVSVDAAGRRRARRDPSPDWFEFFLETPVQASISLSTSSAQLSGHVSLGGKDVIAAPVYLFATTPLTRRRMNGLRSTQTDQNGNYGFGGLAPGTYLVMSSLDVIEVNEEAMAGRARTITLEEGRSITQNLDLSRQQ